MRVNAGGVSLHVIESGAGEPALLFLHYWGGSARTWDTVTQNLARDFRCIAYDQRGWGESDSPPEGNSIRDLASDAKLLIESLGVRQYVLVGHSMGGKVAQFLASERPAGLKALVLVAPAPPTPQKLPEAAKQTQLHAYDNRANALQALEFLTAHLPNQEIQEQVIADNLAGSSQAKLAWPTSSIYEDISKDVSKIAVPTLVLAGDQDRQDSLEQHEREVLARIPVARLMVLRDCGHLLPIDQPEQLADAIRNFVSGLERTSVQ